MTSEINPEEDPLTQEAEKINEEEGAPEDETDPLLFKILSRDAHEQFDACVSNMRRKVAMKKEKMKKLEADEAVDSTGKKESVEVEESGVDASGGDDKKDTEVGKDGDDVEKDNKDAENVVPAAADDVQPEKQDENLEDDGEDEYSAPFSLIASHLEESNTSPSTTGPSRHTLDVRIAAKVDFFCSVLTFTRETCKMSIEQSSVVLSMCAQLLETIVAPESSLGVFSGRSDTEESQPSTTAAADPDDMPSEAPPSPAGPSSSSRELLKLVKGVLLPRMGQDEKKVNFTSEHVKKITDFVVTG